MSEPPDDAPLILSLWLDPDSAAALTALRAAHFPAERNYLDAHITLFHALPGEELEGVQRTLENVCAETLPFSVSLPGVRFTGRGVAVAVESEELRRIRGRLAAEWEAWLTPQDRQGYRPHVTIQNKVTTETARALFERLSPEWTPRTARAEGLDLWRYRGGPWEFVSRQAFSQRKSEERSE